MLPRWVVPAKEHPLRSDTDLILSTFNLHVLCELAKILSSAAVAKLGPQKRPFAKEKQNLIACRRSTQTYSQKSPNYPQKGPKIVSGFPPKNSLFVPPAAVVWWSQAASELLEKYPWCCSCSCCCLHKHSDTQKLFAHKPFLTQFFLQRYFQNRNTFEQKRFHTKTLLFRYFF